MRKKTEWSELISLMLIIILTISISFVVYFSLCGMVLPSEKPVIIIFSNSSSNILSSIGKTYLSGEDAEITIVINNSEINFVSIENKNLTLKKIDNHTFMSKIDTLIESGSSKETKIILIHGKNFTQGENYEVIANSEEFLLEKSQSAENLAKKANSFSIWAIIISIILFIIDQLINYYYWKKPKKKETNNRKVKK